MVNENRCYSVVALNKYSYPQFLAVRRRNYNISDGLPTTTHFNVHISGPDVTYAPTDTALPTHTEVFHKRFSFRFRQLQNETYGQFIDRNKAEALAMESYETADAREKRLSRELLNRSHPLPSTSSPRVFVWHYNKTYGLEIRSPVDQRHLEYLWRTTTEDELPIPMVCNKLSHFKCSEVRCDDHRTQAPASTTPHIWKRGSSINGGAVICRHPLPSKKRCNLPQTL